MRNKTGNDMALESINTLVRFPDQVTRHLNEHRIFNEKVADLIFEYLEKHGEDELIKYITSLEEGLEAAIKRIEELEEASKDD